MKWPKREGFGIRNGLIRRIGVALLLILPALGANLALAQDFQSWNEVDLTAWWKNVDFLVPLLARVDSHLPNPQLAATGITADVALSPHLTITAGYLFAVVPQRSLNVHLPLAALTPTLKFHHLLLADRNRIEKLVGFANSPVRYRNRFLVDMPFGAKERWHMFVDDEVIFNLTDGNWSQNRFQVGGGRQFTSRTLLDVYYLRRNLSGGVATQNILGTTLRVALRSRTQAVREPEKNRIEQKRSD